MVGRRAVRTLASAGVLALTVSACTNTPPPVPGPTSVQTTPTSETTANQIIIGVDAITGGYNPHQLADTSTTTAALSQLLLPSVFRTSPAGKYQLDKTLMRSAEVLDEPEGETEGETESEPGSESTGDEFAVAYTIRQDASWSDGAPIAAEDFAYLADQLRAQPGTVNPAGYRLITDVESHEGGKRVVVRFAERYPGWRGLFANLLPSHLLKDVPGGWQGAMEGSYPAYGGPFAIKTVDAARGEILIERNERYWEKPSAVDQLILRSTGDDGPAADLRNQNLQFALTGTDAEQLADLREVDGVYLTTVNRPAVAEVLLRPNGETLSDTRVRAAVASLVDRAALVEAAADGGPAAKLRADAQVLAPSERGYLSSLPENRSKPDKARANRLLRNAGYQRDDQGWQDAEGRPLTLTIASPGEKEPYATIAAELAEQLSDAGVQARAVQPDARALYAVDPADPDAEPIDDGTGREVNVDVVVGPRAVSADPASDFASRFSCRTTDSDGAGPEIEPGNPAGFCDQRLESTVRSVLTGQRSLRGALESLEPRLWQASVTIPLYQLADTLSLSQDVAGVTEGPPLAGPFGAAVNWIRISE